MFPWKTLLTLLGGAGVIGTIVLSFATLGANAGRATAEKQAKAASAERDGLVNWASQVCALTLQPFKVVDAKGKDDRANWGRACSTRIQALALFHTNTLASSNQVMAKAQTDQIAKTEADLKAARADAVSARAAYKKLMEARSHVQADNLVGPEYFHSLNLSAGLRDPAGEERLTTTR